jgi:hypothetical protein
VRDSVCVCVCAHVDASVHVAVDPNENANAPVYDLVDPHVTVDARRPPAYACCMNVSHSRASSRLEISTRPLTLVMAVASANPYP